MEIDFEPGWLCVCLSQKPGQAPLRPVAAGGLSLCRTKAGEHPAFVRRTNTRTKAERLRANQVRPVPFGFRQAAPGFQRWNAGRRRSAHDGPAIMEPAGPTSTRPSDRVIATGARRVGDTAGAPRHGRRPQRPGSRRDRLRFAGSYLVAVRDGAPESDRPQMPPSGPGSRQYRDAGPSPDAMLPMDTCWWLVLSTRAPITLPPWRDR